MGVWQVVTSIVILYTTIQFTAESLRGLFRYRSQSVSLSRQRYLIVQDYHRVLFSRRSAFPSTSPPRLLSNVKSHLHLSVYVPEYQIMSRSQWPRGLRRRSLAARLLRLWVRIPPGAWKFVCCECCVLSGRGLCDGLIIRSEKSYRMWRVVVCDQETS